MLSKMSSGLQQHRFMHLYKVDYLSFAFQNCFMENQQTIKELLWKRKQIQGSEKQQVVPYISPAEQLPSTRKVCKEYMYIQLRKLLLLTNNLLLIGELLIHYTTRGFVHASHHALKLNYNTQHFLMIHRKPFFGLVFWANCNLNLKIYSPNPPTPSRKKIIFSWHLCKTILQENSLKHHSI